MRRPVVRSKGCCSKMLKKTAGFVLTSLRGSTVKKNQAGGVYPFTKNNSMGERLTRSAVCTSSASGLNPVSLGGLFQHPAGYSSIKSEKLSGNTDCSFTSVLST